MAFGLKSECTDTPLPCFLCTASRPLCAQRNKSALIAPLRTVLKRVPTNLTRTRNHDTMPIHYRADTPAVILLAFVLAAGFLLVILSCALWNNWLPLLVGESCIT